MVCPTHNGLRSTCCARTFVPHSRFRPGELEDLVTKLGLANECTTVLNFHCAIHHVRVKLERSGLATSEY